MMRNFAGSFARNLPTMPADSRRHFRASLTRKLTRFPTRCLTVIEVLRFAFPPPVHRRFGLNQSGEVVRRAEDC